MASASGWQLLNTFPHHDQAFTQGLSYHDGNVYETTGQFGESQLLRYSLGDSEPEVIHQLRRRYFGEGSVIVNGEAIWLTWQRGTAFAVNLESGERRIAFNYEGEGWGLAKHPTQDRLVMSNGSDQLRFLDLDGTVLNTLQVRGGARRWDQLNELEWVNDTIFANRWHTQEIIAIDATTGRVKAIYDFARLWREHSKHQTLTYNMSFNGIAYKTDSNTFLVTGKYWNQIYEVSLEGWQ